MSTTFPTSIDSLTNVTDGVDYPEAADINNLNDSVEALEAKVGIDSSAVATSLDYKLKNTSGGHDHDGSDSKKVITTNLDNTGLTVSQLLRVNSAGTAIESSGKTVPTGTIVGDTDTQTLTLKTLTTPVIASFYQDAGKTKLMTTPSTASDTLAAIAATQTLTNKTLTTPVVASLYQDAGKTLLLTMPAATDTLVGKATTDTLTNKTLTTPTLTSPVLNTGLSGTAFLDEDNMASNSATKTVSQQSIKAYVDTAITNVKSALFPIGAIYTAVVSTNPATLLGFGTWSAFGAGKVLVGLNSADTDFDTAEETGGAKTANLAHTHTGPSHTHDVVGNTGYESDQAGATGYNSAGNEFADKNHNHAVSIASAAGGTGATGSGGSATQSIMNPFIVVYFWKRTA
jgi:hypothetical protein